MFSETGFCFFGGFEEVSSVSVGPVPPESETFILYVIPLFCKVFGTSFHDSEFSWHVWLLPFLL